MREQTEAAHSDPLTDIKETIKQMKESDQIVLGEQTGSWEPCDCEVKCRMDHWVVRWTGVR